jgi:hypothetical protein
MKSRRTIPIVTAALALALAFPLTVRTDDKDKDKDRDRDRNLPQDVIIDFGAPQPQPGGAANLVVVPDEASIRRGGTATFRVNGTNHGIAIYPVSRRTTREEITAQLCPHDATGVCTDATFANGDHTIVDGKGNIVIVTGTNPPFARVDDPTDRLLATSTQLGNVPGAFLVGTTATTAGNQVQVRFRKSGRFLVVCMNRGHALNAWMFGFVNVGNDRDDDHHHGHDGHDR